MPHRKPLPFFDAVFSGANLTPESIPINTVSRILSAINRLASGVDDADEEEDQDEAEEDSSQVRLLDIKRGSAVFRFTAQQPAQTLTRLKIVGDVLDNPDELGNNTYVLKPLEYLSSVAISLKCSITLRKSNNEG